MLEKESYEHFTPKSSTWEAGYLLALVKQHPQAQQQKADESGFPTQETTISPPYPVTWLPTDSWASLTQICQLWAKLQAHNMPGCSSLQQPADGRHTGMQHTSGTKLTSSLKCYSQNIRFKILILISTAYKACGQKLTGENVLFIQQI